MTNETQAYFREIRQEVQEILTETPDIPPRRILERRVYKLDLLIQDIQVKFSQMERQYMRSNDPEIEREVKRYERKMINLGDLKWQIAEPLKQMRNSDSGNEELPSKNFIRWIDRDTLIPFLNELKKAGVIEDRSAVIISMEHFSKEEKDSTKPISWLHPQKDLLAYMIRQLDENSLVACRNLWEETEPHFMFNGKIVKNLQQEEEQYLNSTEDGKPKNHELVDEVIEQFA
ncbi:hypothetical protein NC796_06250 [Aliifodinibius sp. S!AR15-10]|uniref:hypothetical protein n=1 Tax=Aliifodinibius sp. S!AR15-10 TaxID=2950437 RepID=UPI00285CEFF7|nr:hypothetical protein [Aliifodinibius sp. S!AR15-10]MDR8390728.1 hypothetical protein [Aliifodinibius sp. S!AR15-10]